MRCSPVLDGLGISRKMQNPHYQQIQKRIKEIKKYGAMVDERTRKARACVSYPLKIKKKVYQADRNWPWKTIEG